MNRAFYIWCAGMSKPVLTWCHLAAFDCAGIAVYEVRSDFGHSALSPRIGRPQQVNKGSSALARGIPIVDQGMISYGLSIS